MEGLVILLALAILALPFVAIAALIRAGKANELAQNLAGRITVLEREIRQLRERSRETIVIRETADARAAEPEKTAPVTITPPLPKESPPRKPANWLEEELVSEREPTRAPQRETPPPLPAFAATKKPEPIAAKSSEPPQKSAPAAVVPPPIPPKTALPPIDWEQFMGAKLFAWIGGLALFLGVAFFVKYSFEHDLIPPAVRVAIGFALGIGLLIGGVAMKKKAYAVTAQTLCGTGVLILYASTFAAHAFYHFAFFGVVPTFLLMSLVTAVAFLLAVRLDAPVVAILGMLGGFLTPVLLSTGEDRPLALFGYIALLDIGLLAVALNRRWNYLAPLGAAGTSVMLIVWASEFFVRESYFLGSKVLIPMAVLVGFVVLFLGASALAKRRDWKTLALPCSAFSLAWTALIFGCEYLAFPSLGQRPLLIFGFIFIIDLAFVALVLLEKKLMPVQAVTGIFIFGILAVWTHHYLVDALLYHALGIYLLFAIFHAAVPLALQRAATPPWWSHLFPALALVLALGPMLKIDALSLVIWPFILLIDVLAIIIAMLTTALLPIALVLVLTLVLIGAWIFQIPATLSGLPVSLWMLGAFAIFFVLASAWASRRILKIAAPAAARGPISPEHFAKLLPSSSAVLPFLLLLMVVARLPLPNPSPVFGLALLLIVLLLGVTRILAVDVLPLVGLLSTLALEHAWHARAFDPAHAALPLAWNVGFYAIFAAFPFFFRRDFSGKVLPWIAAALSGPLHFKLIHSLIQTAWPNRAMGLLPAAFAIPSLLALVVLVKSSTPSNPARNSQLAWFGGVALFFITLIFPIQFDRQWITIGWALEGVALCWLYHRVVHRGLRLVGIALLVVAFARLALNPAVLDYHPRGDTAIWNWFLYAYSVVTVCLFAGARLLAPPRNLLFGFQVPPLLNALGTVLAFLLVNIEIADYFTAPGAVVITFSFSGNLARDMSYSIAWALFALLLVIIGIRKKSAPIRWAGLGLLGITLAKLLLHDLSQLSQLYRIAALIIVAIIAMLASFLYQRFLSTVENSR